MRRKGVCNLLIKISGYFVLVLNTAVDFRARLRFPRSARKTPRSYLPVDRKEEAARSEATSIRHGSHKGALCLFG
jgi:hypothetical protein